MFTLRILMIFTIIIFNFLLQYWILVRNPIHLCIVIWQYIYVLHTSQVLNLVLWCLFHHQIFPWNIYEALKIMFVLSCSFCVYNRLNIFLCYFYIFILSYTFVWHASQCLRAYAFVHLMKLTFHHSHTMHFIFLSQYWDFSIYNIL